MCSFAAFNENLPKTDNNLHLLTQADIEAGAEKDKKAKTQTHDTTLATPFLRRDNSLSVPLANAMEQDNPDNFFVGTGHLTIPRPPPQKSGGFNNNTTKVLKTKIFIDAETNLSRLRLFKDPNLNGQRYDILIEDPQSKEPCFAMMKLPIMHSPLARTDAFAAQGKNRGKRTLVLDFVGLENRRDLQGFHWFMNQLDTFLWHLCVDEVGAPRDELVCVEVAPMLRQRKSVPDRVNLKFQSGALKFRGPHMQQLKESDIDFTQVVVSPTVWLKDIWLHDGVFYPRLELMECFVKPKHMEFPNTCA